MTLRDPHAGLPFHDGGAAIAAPLEHLSIPTPMPWAWTREPELADFEVA
jgi:hypothetical protein